MPTYSVVNGLNPGPMQHPAITLVDVNGAPWDPSTSIVPGTYVQQFDASRYGSGEAAIIAAGTAAHAVGGGVVLLPAGTTWTCPGQVVFRNLTNVSLLAVGATILSGYAGVAVLFESCSNGACVGLTVSNTNTGARTAGYDGIQLLNCADFDVHDNKVGYVRNVGIRINGGKRVSVYDNTVNGCLADGIGCYNGTRSSGANAALTTGGALTVNDGAVRLSQLDVGAWVTVPTAGAAGATLLTQIQSVSSTTAATVSPGAAVNVSNVAITVNYLCDEVTISDNHALSTGDDSYSVVTYNTVGGNFPVAWTGVHTNITITGNTLKASSARGIALAGCDEVTVTGNTVDTPVKAGIVVIYDSGAGTQGTSNAAVTGNTVKNANVSGAFTASIIASSLSASYPVTGITIDSNTITGGSGFIYVGGATGSGVTNVGVSMNTCTAAAPVNSHGIFVQNVVGHRVIGNLVNGAWNGGVVISGGDHPCCVSLNQVQNTNVSTTWGASIVVGVGLAIVIGNHVDEARAGSNIDCTNAPGAMVLANQSAVGQTLFPTNTGATQIGGAFRTRAVTKSAAYATAVYDQWINATAGTWTLTLSTFTSGAQVLFLSNTGSGVITLAPSSGTLTGTATLPAGAAAIAVCDGTNWTVLADSGIPRTPAAGSLAVLGYPYTVDPGMIRGSDSSNPGGANAATYLRCMEGGTISKIGLDCVTSSGNISVAVHQNSGSGRASVPGTRLATSGAVACPAVGYAEVSLGATVTLAAGDWIAISADNGTAAFRSLLNGSTTTNLGLGRQFVASSSHPLPSTPSGLAARVGLNIVLVGVA